MRATSFLEGTLTFCQYTTKARETYAAPQSKRYQYSMEFKSSMKKWYLRSIVDHGFIPNALILLTDDLLTTLVAHNLVPDSWHAVCGSDKMI